MHKDSSGWLPERDWKRIQALVPITCVDVLPVRLDPAGPREVGLILRKTPHQQERWCLIGGRLLKDESLRDAVARELQEALGESVSAVLSEDLRPTVVAEYFQQRRENALFDPRQHAIGLTFVVGLLGSPQPSGEALDFRWFDLNTLPSAEAFGFDQDRVVEECIQKLDTNAQLAIRE